MFSHPVKSLSESIRTISVLTEAYTYMSSVAESKLMLNSPKNSSFPALYNIKLLPNSSFLAVATLPDITIPAFEECSLYQKTISHFL